MNHVYLVWYDNCEPYDDYYTNVEGVFSSWEDAVSCIESHDGLKKEELEQYELDRDSLDSIFVMKPYWNENRSDDYDVGAYYIDIWDLDTGKKVPYDSKHIFKLIKES